MLNNTFNFNNATQGGAISILNSEVVAKGNLLVENKAVDVCKAETASATAAAAAVEESSVTSFDENLGTIVNTRQSEINANLNASGQDENNCATQEN